MVRLNDAFGRQPQRGFTSGLSDVLSQPVISHMACQNSLFKPSAKNSKVEGLNVDRLHAVCDPETAANNWKSNDGVSLAEYEEISRKIFDIVYEHYTQMINHKKNTLELNNSGLADKLTTDIRNYLSDIHEIDQGRLDIDDFVNPIAAISEDVFNDPYFLEESQTFMGLCSSKKDIYMEDFIDTLLEIFLDSFPPEKPSEKIIEQKYWLN